MILSQMISRCQETIKEFCQRYRDRLNVHLNNLAANLMKAEEIARRLKEKKSINLLSYSTIKHFWIAYSQGCECVYVLHKDMTLIIYLPRYLDKCIAECSINSDSCNQYWMFKKKNYTLFVLYHVSCAHFEIILSALILILVSLFLSFSLSLSLPRSIYQKDLQN